MTIPKPHLKPKPRASRSPAFLLAVAVTLIVLAFLVSSLNSASLLEPGIVGKISGSGGNAGARRGHSLNDKYLYWGNRIDCPGKHCDSCEGLGHQESSLRCALEEAMVLGRWAASSCAMDSLYDVDLISNTVPVILDNSKMWHKVLATAMKLGPRGVAHVQGISRDDLKEKQQYSNLLLINMTASHLSWFIECKDRKNRSAIMLPYSFLPSMAAKEIRTASDKIIARLGDYDAIHVRRGDRLKTRKDRFGADRSLFPHLDQDTHPEFMLKRIEKWVPLGRTLFVASNERTPVFFAPLSLRYRMAYSSNFSEILDPMIQNNYHLFMVERLIMMKAKTFIRTFKEGATDLSLTDDLKNTKLWQIPVYTIDDEVS